MNVEKIKIVKQRLDFVKDLNNVKEHFRGFDKLIINESNNNHDHPYTHFTSLRIYLTLTCFDILGQKDSWMDFGSWLKSEKTQQERSVIFEKHQEKSLNDTLINIHSDYLSIYGVKTSFMSFINKKLSIKNRKKLYESIKGRKRITKIVENSNGSELEYFSDVYNLTEKQKEDFIYELRNKFTHNGLAFTDFISGFVDIEGPINVGTFENPKILSPTFTALKKNINEELVSFQVSNWPNVLIEIIEDTIKTNKS